MMFQSRNGSCCHYPILIEKLIALFLCFQMDGKKAKKTSDLLDRKIWKILHHIVEKAYFVSSDTPACRPCSVSSSPSIDG